MTQQIVVMAAVALAAVYALWHFLPARWRRRTAQRLGLRARVADAGSCHACDDCGACAEPGADSNKQRR